MPDLICYIPNHGYAIGDFLYVSWLDGNYYVRDTDEFGSPKAIDANSFKISTTNDDLNIVQYTVDVTDGYVRQETSDPVTTISGLDHLEGETVTVTSGGNKIGDYIVSEGSVTLDGDLITYQVGLPYSCKVRTTRLASPQAGNALQSQIKRINRTTIRHSKTQGGKVGQEYLVRDNAGVLNMTEFMEDLDCVFDKESRDINSSIKGGVSTDSYTTIRSDVPSPMTIISAVVEFSVEEKR